MFFRKKIERFCSYCQFATKIDDEYVLCIKKGVRSCSSKCRKFTYDPCKRIPAKPKALDFQKYDDRDFSL